MKWRTWAGLIPIKENRELCEREADRIPGLGRKNQTAHISAERPPGTQEWLGLIATPIVEYSLHHSLIRYSNGFDDGALARFNGKLYVSYNATTAPESSIRLSAGING